MPKISAGEAGVEISESSGSAAGGILLVLGVIMTFGGSIGLAGVEWTMGTPLLVSWAVTILGLVFILGFASRSGMDFRWTVTITKNGLAFEREGRMIQYPPDNFVSMEVQVTGDHGNRRRWMYALFLRGRDGSFFWVNTESAPEKLQAWIDAIKRILQVPAYNATPVELPIHGLEKIPVPGSALDPARTETIPVKFDASSLHALVRPADGWEELSLPAKPSWMGRIIMLLVTLLFVGTPLGIGWQALHPQAGEGVSWVTYFAVAPFLTIFILLFLSMLLLSTKRYAVLLRTDQIRMKVRLGSDALARIFPSLLTHERTIQRGEIRSVRTDRLADGNFRLALVRKAPTGKATPLIDKILFQLSFFRSPQTDISEKDEILNLWEIPGSTQRKDGPVVEDLLFLEEKIQERLRVSEP